MSGVWANPQDPNTGSKNDGLSVEGGIATYTITGLENGLATGVFVRSFTGGDYTEGSAESSQWVRLKGENTTPKAAQQQQAAAKTYSVSATASATEGGNATLTITLSEAAPADGVAFTVTAGYSGSSTATAEDVGSITSPVTVAEGNSALDISIPTAQDAVDEDDETFTVTTATAASGWEKEGDGKDTATVTITDDDTAGVTVNPTALNVSEDGSGTYTVVLDSKPTADVTVTPSVSLASYTFTATNWNTAQTFTVAGVADDDINNESVGVSHRVTGADPKYAAALASSVRVSVTDTTTDNQQRTEEPEPPAPGQIEPYNVQVTPGDGTLTVAWTVSPREGVSDDSISVAGGVNSYTITGLQNGVATGVFVRSFTGGDYNEGSPHSSEWVRVKGENTTPKAAE